MTNRIWRRAWVALGVICLAWLAAGPVAGSTFIAMDHGELMVHSDSVIQGRVLSVQSSWDATGRVIISEAEIQVSETLAGQFPGGIIVVQTFGGQVGDYHVEAIGFPRFEEGDEVVLFVNRREALDGAIRVTGHQLGQYRIFEQDGQALAVPAVDDGVVLLRDGRPVAPPAALPLAELKSRLRNLASRLHQLPN